eukprot:1125316-Rhodomonas_salina.1
MRALRKYYVNEKGFFVDRPHQACFSRAVSSCPRVSSASPMSIQLNPAHHTRGSCSPKKIIEKRACEEERKERWRKGRGNGEKRE